MATYTHRIYARRRYRRPTEWLYIQMTAYVQVEGVTLQWLYGPYDVRTWSEVRQRAMRIREAMIDEASVKVVVRREEKR